MKKKYTNTVINAELTSSQPSGRLQGLKFSTLGLILTSIVVLPILLAVILSWLNQRTVLRQRIETNLQSISGLAVAQQSQLVEGTRRLLISMAQTRSLRDGNWPMCEEYAKRLNQELGDYGVIGVHDLKGDVVCSSKPAVNPINLSGTSFFQSELEHVDFSVGYFVPNGEASGKAVVPFSTPLYAPNGKLIGFVFVALDIKRLSDLLGSLMLPPGFSLTLTDWQGTVLGVSPGDGSKLIGRPVANADVMNLIRARRSGRVETESDGEVEHDIRQVAVPAGNGLYLWTTARVNEISSPMRNRFILSMVALIAFFVTIMGLVIAASSILVVAPIQRLLDAIKTIGHDNYKEDTAKPKFYVRELQILKGGLTELSTILERRVRQRTEAIAAAEEARLEMLGILNRMTDGFLVLDLQWKIRFENRSASAVFQHQKSKLVGLDFWSLLSSENLPQIKDEAEQQIRLKYDWSSEDYYEALDSWLEIRIYPTGDSVGVFARDTTEKRMFFERLKQRERQNSELFTSNPQAMAVYEVETMKILAVNDSAVRLCGYSEGELLSRTMIDIAPAEDQQNVRDLISHPPERRRSDDQGLIWRLARKDGRVLLIEVVGHRYEFRGRNARMIMLTDVSNRLIKENKRRMENEELKRTVKILTAHVGRRDYLRGLAERLAGDTRKSLHILRKSPNHGAKEVAWDMLEDQLNLLGQIAWAKGREARPEMINLSELAENAAAALANDQRYSGTNLEIAPKLQCFSDPRMVTVLLENILAFVLRTLKGRPASWVSLDSAGAHRSTNIFRITARTADQQALHELQLISDPAAIAAALGNFSTADVQFRLAATIAQMLGGGIWSEPQEAGSLTLDIQLAAGGGRAKDFIRDVVVDTYEEEDDDERDA